MLNYLMALLSLLKLVYPAEAAFDLFIDAVEAEKLLGLRTQAQGDQTQGGIYYVRNGVKNDYAVTNSDNQLVPNTMDELTFHWRSSPSSRISYSIHLIHKPTKAMQEPVLVNAAKMGRVPSKERTFKVRLECTGKASEQVDFLLQIKFVVERRREDQEIKAEDQEQVLNFKRKKVCLVAQSSSFAEENKELSNFDNIDITDEKSQSTSMIALGSATGAILLMLILLAVMYLTSKRDSAMRRRTFLLSNSRHSSLVNLRSFDDIHYYGTSSTSASTANRRSDSSMSGTYKNGILPAAAHHHQQQPGQRNTLIMENGTLKLRPANLAFIQLEPLPRLDEFLPPSQHNIEEEVEEEEEAIRQGDVSIYPHLMPQNFSRARSHQLNQRQAHHPRGSQCGSSSSVLV